jgi:hypothetical protein
MIQSRTDLSKIPGPFGGRLVGSWKRCTLSSRERERERGPMRSSRSSALEGFGKYEGGEAEDGADPGETVDIEAKGGDKSSRGRDGTNAPEFVGN